MVDNFIFSHFFKQVSVNPNTNPPNPQPLYTNNQSVSAHIGNQSQFQASSFRAIPQTATYYKDDTSSVNANFLSNNLNNNFLLSGFNNNSAFTGYIQPSELQNHEYETSLPKTKTLDEAIVNLRVTLPGFLIYYLNKIKKPLNEEEMIEIITPNFDNFIKTDGTRVKGDISKVLKGILVSSGLFKKCEDKDNQDKWYFLEKPALEFALRNMNRGEIKENNKTNIIIQQLSAKENDNLESNKIAFADSLKVLPINTNKKGFLRKRSLSRSRELKQMRQEMKEDLITKSILNELMKMEKNRNQITNIISNFKGDKLQKKFHTEETLKGMTILETYRVDKVNEWVLSFNCLSDIQQQLGFLNNSKFRSKNVLKKAKNQDDLLVKCENMNVLYGILACYRYFKPLINKYIKEESRRIKASNKNILKEQVEHDKMKKKISKLSQRLNTLEKKFKNSARRKSSIGLSTS